MTFYEKARAELDAATELLSRLQVVESSIRLPPLVVMPAVNFPCRLRRRALSAPHAGTVIGTTPRPNNCLLRCETSRRTTEAERGDSKSLSGSD